MSEKDPVLEKNERTVELWLDGKHVATVEFLSGKVSQWSYTDEWIKNGFELSPALDFSTEVKASSAEAYLENLFPEGEVFDSLVEIIGVSKGNHFSILKSLGKETSGCLMFLSPGEKPDLIEPSIRIIGADEFERRVAKSDDLPVTFWDGRVRLSVAGLQRKINVVYAKQGEIIGLPEGSYSSTHIIKFEKNSQENLVLNEKLTLETARRLGIPVCNTEILSIADRRLLLVERFDRSVSEENKVAVKTKMPIAGVKPEEELRVLESNYSHGVMDLPSVKRVHIIDGCQALGLRSELKYERHLGDGAEVRHSRLGVSFEDLGALSALCVDPKAARISILRWGIFNLAVGNFDAHGKNISFTLSEKGLDLAPFYDLVSIESLGGKFKDTFAMGYGDNFGETPFEWGDLCKFAVDLRVEESDLISNALDILTSLPGALKMSLSSLPPTTDKENTFITKLRHVCESRSAYLAGVIQKEINGSLNRLSAQHTDPGNSFN